MNEILVTELLNHHFCTFNLESHYTLFVSGKTSSILCEY